MITATYVSATTFTVSGDRTVEFHVGRRIKHIGDTTGYGTIESVTIPVADTQVVLTAASDNLDVSLTGVYYGIVGSNEPITSMPIHTHDGDEGSGGDIFASPTFTGQATIPTINLTGGQIAFPATAVPSADPNTLDDYEKGTWTPDLQFGGAKVGITYSAQSGTYIKIGNFISVICGIILTSKGTSTGAATVSLLPFEIKTGIIAPVSLFLNKVTFANNLEAAVFVQAVSLYEITEAGTASALADTDFANDSIIRINCTYSI